MKSVVMAVINKGTVKKYKVDTHDKATAETVVRSQSYWFGNNTIFIVKDPMTNAISVFKKINTDNAIAGYSEIVELSEKDCLNYLFDY